MKESIYTIPISEVFEPKCGCPLCALHLTLEQRWVEYITGAAMMEPDVRIKTNEEGFCAHHYAEMLKRRNRLSVALMLQSHMQNAIDKLSAPSFGKKPVDFGQGCFICGMVGREFTRILENIAVVWGRDKDFQLMYIQQENLCIIHAGQMIAAAEKKLRGKIRTALVKDSKTLALRGLNPLKEDIDAFCGLYDYRSAHCETPPKTVSTAIERAVAYLTSRPQKDINEE